MMMSEKDNRSFQFAVRRSLLYECGYVGHEKDDEVAPHRI